MHYEFMGPESPHIDSIQFHVSSSLKKAEKYIRSSGVDSHSWWQVHPHPLDADGEEMQTEGDKVYYYNYGGTRLKSAPVKRARAAFTKHVAKYHDIYSSPASSKG